MIGSIVLAIALAQAGAAAGNPPASGSPQPSRPPAGQASPERPWPPAGVIEFERDASITAPRLIKEVPPKYTKAAKKARVSGIVSLVAVVERDGKVGEARVIRSLDSIYGLDAEAIKTVKKWRFKPGTKDGVAVPVLVEVEMTFTLR